MGHEVKPSGLLPRCAQAKRFIKWVRQAVLRVRIPMEPNAESFRTGVEEEELAEVPHVRTGVGKLN
jgi:hypothetical protein